MSFEKNIRGEFVRILGKEWVKDDQVTLYTYRCDGLALYTAPPMGVCFPEQFRNFHRSSNCSISTRSVLSHEAPAPGFREAQFLRKEV